jgi:HEAT repeat protein
MQGKHRLSRTLRWALSVLIVAAGLTTAWAWSSVAGPHAPALAPVTPVLYAAWQPSGAPQALLFRSSDQGVSWEPLAWAGDGANRVAVSLSAGPVFSSEDRGESWKQVAGELLPVLSLAWDSQGDLYFGTAGHGIYRQAAGGALEPIAAGQQDLASKPVSHLALVGGRLFAATPAALFYTDDGGQSWQPLAGPSFPQAKPASALLATSDQPLYVSSVAADGLQRYAPDVAGALATLRQSTGDVQSRATAARILGLARAHEASGPLLAAVADPSPAVSQAAGEALGRIADPRTTSNLLLALQSPIPQVQRSAATALGMMRAEAAVAPLSAMLLRGDPAMAGVAAEALGRIGSQDATQALLTALADAQMTTRRHTALSALEAMGEPAVNPLQQMLASSPDAAARGHAAEALGWIASPSATAALVQALEDSDSAVRARTAWALGELAAPQARAALERAQARDPSQAVRQAASQALTQIAGQPVVRTSRLASWALALSRWDRLLTPVLWSLILALSMLAAAWLWMVGRRRSPAPVV